MPGRRTAAADDGAPVGFFRQVTQVDRRRLAQPVRLGLDIATRQRPHLPGAGAEARSVLEFADLPVLEAARREGALHIGGRRLLQYLDRGGDDRGAVGQHAFAGEEPAHDLAAEWQAARALVGGLRPDDRVGDARDIVVLHVLAHAAQFMHDRHADLPEMLGIADPRQLQDVRRADRPRRQDHLSHRIGSLDNPLTLCRASRDVERSCPDVDAGHAEREWPVA